ncbi:hypothetical protein AB4342_19765, partial [Vibrio breoganii]
MSKLLIGLVLGSYLIGFTSSAADEKVQRAESAAHSDLSSKATILDTDGSVLREGNPHWHCVPG